MITKSVNVKCSCGHTQTVSFSVENTNVRFLEGLVDSDQFCDKCTQLRKWVVQFMHYNGCHRHLLNETQFAHVYLQADGFGKIKSIKEANEKYEWDWSHVRDSSIAAFTNMAYVLRSQFPEIPDWEHQ